MSTVNDKKVAFGVTNTTETPYSIKKKTQIVEFSIITPEHFKFIKPLDKAILSIIPGGDPDLTKYLKKVTWNKQTRPAENHFLVS